jgi:hypothetical protein
MLIRLGPSRRSLAPFLAVFALAISCARPIVRPTVNPATIPVEQLWIEPDIAARDLFYGPGGAGLAPKEEHPFTFVKLDATGYSPGYDVRAPDGTTWSVKLGSEAQPEVASSRLLWAIGYHQPPTYLLAKWTLTGEKSGPQDVGRFRPDPKDETAADEWSFYENDFLETRELRGLLVANLIVNNWDWKDSNNKIYETTQPHTGKPARRYVVRDLGASFGKTTSPIPPFRGQGTRNDLEGYESQRLIKAVNGERIEFDYHGRHKRLVETIEIGDVVWTCRLFARLSDRQLDSAFRAAGFTDEMRQRYIAKLKSKIAEGLALSTSKS